MTKIGEFPVDRSDGGRDWIDLHEPGTFDHDPVLIELSDGRRGTPFLKPLGEGDTGLLFQDSAGNYWQANRQGILVVEDWEDGFSHDRWNWENNQFSGDMYLTSTSIEGNYSAWFEGYRLTAAMPDYPDPAPHLPVGIGDTLQFHFRFPHASDIDEGEQYWFAFLIQDAPHYTTTSASPDWDRLYTVEAITGSNDLFRISRREGSTRYPYTGDGRATVDWRSSTWYRGELAIWDTGFGIDLYRHTGGDSWVYEATVLGDAPKWPSGGIGIRNSGNGGKSVWDIIRKVP